MKKRTALLLAACLLLSVSGCGNRQTTMAATSAATETETAAQNSSEQNTEQSAAEITPTDTAAADKTEGAETMTIQIQANGNTIKFALNDSQAAKSLYAQLPLTVENEDFSNNEKTFYPPQKLDVSGAPHTDGSVGTLAYYEPWGDVVLFYGSYNPNGSLYELGKVTEGSEFISQISGEMVITAAE
ncbi:MAG: cyclophilin-like fold protein [Eubacteriales bacterium]|nr:cyclophilin-like fold protein [Eubacteriales bacterium]